MARNQTEGKGQIGRTWHSSAGQNLCFSLILKPRFLQPQSIWNLSMAMALGILDYAKSHFQSQVWSLKWPNDLLFGDRKMAGLLINNQIQGKSLEYAIIGIGFNLNEKAFPKDIPNPISLHEITQQHHIPEEEMGKMLLFLEERYRQLRSGSFDELEGALSQGNVWHPFAL